MMPLQRNVKSSSGQASLYLIQITYFYMCVLCVCITLTCSSLDEAQEALRACSNPTSFHFLQPHCHLFSSRYTTSSFSCLRAYAHPHTSSCLPFTTTIVYLRWCLLLFFSYYFTLLIYSAYQNLQIRFFKSYFLSVFPSPMCADTVSILDIMYNQWLVLCLVYHW